MVLIYFPHLTVYPSYPPIPHIMVTSVMSYTHQLCLIPPCITCHNHLHPIAHKPYHHSHAITSPIIIPFFRFDIWNLLHPVSTPCLHFLIPISTPCKGHPKPISGLITLEYSYPFLVVGHCPNSRDFNGDCVEESNALALAIVPSGSAVAPTFDSGVFLSKILWSYCLGVCLGDHYEQQYFLQQSREEKEAATVLYAIRSFPDDRRRVVDAALLFAALAIGFAWWRQRKPQEQFFDVSAEDDPEVHLGQFKGFSPWALQVATGEHVNEEIGDESLVTGCCN